MLKSELYYEFHADVINLNRVITHYFIYLFNSCPVIKDFKIHSQCLSEIPNVKVFQETENNHTDSD